MGVPATVEKVNSSYNLGEYEKQKSKVDALKNQVKIQAGKEATALRKQLTKQQTMGSPPGSPKNREAGEQSLLNKPERINTNPDKNHTDVANHGSIAEKSDISASDFSEGYKKLIHNMNEEIVKVELFLFSS
jgi:hypothetical protein